MTVNSVTVNGRPARFRFAQPTYPGDPNGPDDPSPAAHEASESNPVGGPHDNPLPPACMPELPDTNATADSMDGTPVPRSQGQASAGARSRTNCRDRNDRRRRPVARFAAFPAC